jgi:putative membrane-bound dehydrogenase-like protein
MRSSVCGALFLVASVAIAAASARAADDSIPHNQDAPPNEARSPEEAAAKMTVPPGFSVEVVAAEPDIVNPVAMTFDERGRVWITESLEYPRREPGVGRDRIKVLEDTDGDGRMDKFTIFAEGLNIPSGIAVGYGGVWVANSPDLLFLQDTDGDGRADKQEVVLTGFGRDDTHELPNSLTWGPDGWLYGLNGVFNPSHIEYRGKTYDFTCALFRIHPKTRDFELFCEGTSNPWGVAFDHDGSAFISACVIDHLWHLAETAYYVRQGGPYPSFTWPAPSIVKHKHQKAAYCGIHYFDSDAYPPEYRDQLYMGNIHGNCLNVDVLERRGSTYFARPKPDFLSANDSWFMPVVQKTGPDGCLWVLDWYDRYHCYQDANRDPAGIDRLKGRLYRVRYQDTPRAGKFDLAKESDDQLIARLASPNVFFRDLAQRVLTERLISGEDHAAALTKLQTLVLDDAQPRKARMHGLWALVGGGPLDEQFHAELWKQKQDATLRAWAVRAAGQRPRREIQRALVASLEDSSPDVQLQAVIALGKLARSGAIEARVEPEHHPKTGTILNSDVESGVRGTEGVVRALTRCVAKCGDDPFIPHVVWQNLHPLLEEHADSFVEALARQDLASPGLAGMLPLAVERILSRKSTNAEPLAALIDVLTRPNGNPKLARQCLTALASKVQSGELAGESLAGVRSRLGDQLARLAADESEQPLRDEAVLLAASWQDPSAVESATVLLASTSAAEPLRLRAIQSLASARHEQLPELVAGILAEPRANATEFRKGALAALGKLDSPVVATAVLARFDNLEPVLQPQAIELLTQRPGWAAALVSAVEAKQIPATAINDTQVRRLASLGDEDLQRRVTAIWGTIRSERNPAREQVIAHMRRFLRTTPGDAVAGQAVFAKLCGQCHKIHGQGEDVGPDITLNGRNSFEQLLSNVFDPSLTIGSAYQARTVATADGRVLTGLLAEDSPQRVVLKLQGGKTEVVARDDVELVSTSNLSLMPENLEEQLKSQELADLFAFITLDKPPQDPEARRLPGAGQLQPRETENPAEFAALLGEVAPGFSVTRAGEGGLALLAEHSGRPGVLRTHPIDQETPTKLVRKLRVPEGKRTRLVIDVAHDKQGDWQLVVRANGQPLHETDVSKQTTEQGWSEVTVDLSPLAGQEVELELENRANGWDYEFGYWGSVDVISE